jgi:hypothetical protein
MSGKQYRLLLVLTILSALVGSMVSNFLFREQIVGAQPTVQQVEDIRTERMVVVDKEGNSRAFFGLNNDGELSWQLFDKDGDPRFALEVDKKGGLQLEIAKSKRVLLRFSSLSTGAPQLEILNRYGHPRAAFGLNVSDEPQLEIRNRYGDPRAALGLDALGEPTLVFYDKGKQKKIRVQLGIETDGMPILRFFDNDGKPLRSVP